MFRRRVQFSEEARVLAALAALSHARVFGAVPSASRTVGESCAPAAPVRRPKAVR